MTDMMHIIIMSDEQSKLTYNHNFSPQSEMQTHPYPGAPFLLFIPQKTHCSSDKLHFSCTFITESLNIIIVSSEKSHLTPNHNFSPQFRKQTHPYPDASFLLSAFIRHTGNTSFFRITSLFLHISDSLFAYHNRVR